MGRIYKIIRMRLVRKKQLHLSYKLRAIDPMPVNFPGFQEALHIIRTTPRYAPVAVKLAQMASDNRIHINPHLEDRAHAGLLGTITLGPEAVESSALSLAQTLVHEHFHLRQHPLLKTVSFWSGVATRTPVMKRYEQPAYQAAMDFLEATKRAHPPLASEAEVEQNAIRQVFAAGFGGTLT